MMDATPFQDQIPHNNCFGCGPHNDHGLRIKSRWVDTDVAEVVAFKVPNGWTAGSHLPKSTF